MLSGRHRIESIVSFGLKPHMHCDFHEKICRLIINADDELSFSHILSRGLPQSCLFVSSPIFTASHCALPRGNRQSGSCNTPSLRDRDHARIVASHSVEYIVFSRSNNSEELVQLKES